MSAINTCKMLTEMFIFAFPITFTCNKWQAIHDRALPTVLKVQYQWHIWEITSIPQYDKDMLDNWKSSGFYDRRWVQCSLLSIVWTVLYTLILVNPDLLIIWKSCQHIKYWISGFCNNKNKNSSISKGTGSSSDFSLCPLPLTFYFWFYF